MFLPDNQAIHCQLHIPHGNNQTPCQDETAYHTADDEIKYKQRDTAAEGATAWYDPEAHLMDAERQAAEYP